MYIFDIERAKAMVRDGRELVEMYPEDVRAAVDDCTIDEEHVGHVDPSIPGIIGHIRFRTPEGELLKGHALIDGHHRAARCLRDSIPYFAYLLTEEESTAILLKRPEDAYTEDEVAVG
jgi:hypothetical protein